VISHDTGTVHTPVSDAITASWSTALASPPLSILHTSWVNQPKSNERASEPRENIDLDLFPKDGGKSDTGLIKYGDGFFGL